MDTRTILVTGATGAQGGSVARHLLARGGYAVRALTRDPDSDRARALRDAGAETVQGDLSDPASLRAALEGADGVFGVTNFWEHFGREREHGRNLVDAVAASGVEQFVFSTLPHAKAISGGELEVPHFDIKAELEQYARQRVPGATFIHVAFYYENFLSFFPPRRQEDGTFVVGFPQGDTPLAGVAVEDLGGVVAPIFDRPGEFRTRTVGVVGDDLPASEYARTLSRVLGKTVLYQHVPREVFAAYGFPGADDLANMFDFNRRFIPDRRADAEESRRLYPGMQTFETWLQAHTGDFADVIK
jgi:uncharacterized protein YbjT (DUF2867 family)